MWQEQEWVTFLSWFVHIGGIALAPAICMAKAAWCVQLPRNQALATGSKEQKGRHWFGRNLGYLPECNLLLAAPHKGNINMEFSMELYN